MAESTSALDRKDSSNTTTSPRRRSLPVPLPDGGGSRGGTGAGAAYVEKNATFAPHPIPDDDRSKVYTYDTRGLKRQPALRICAFLQKALVACYFFLVLHLLVLPLRFLDFASYRECRSGGSRRILQDRQPRVGWWRRWWLPQQQRPPLPTAEGVLRRRACVPGEGEGTAVAALCRGRPV